MNNNILVIDDDGMITKTMRNLLKREGYNVDISESGKQAIEKIRTIDLDLIITDIRMPQMDGLETMVYIRKILKDEKKQDVPIIFITGYADSDAHIKAEKLGKVIFKPFDMRVFLEEVAKSLGKR